MWQGPAGNRRPYADQQAFSQACAFSSLKNVSMS
jgi:hypothetical protein